MKYFLLTIVLLFVVGVGGGFAYVAYTDAPVSQEQVTKTVPLDGLINE